MHAVSLTLHARFLSSKIDLISANSKQNSKRLSPRESEAQGVLFDEKNPKVENLVTLSL
jgi:hypothetical protein